MDGRNVVQQKHYIWNCPGWKKLSQRNSFLELPSLEEKLCFLGVVKSHGRKEGCIFFGGEVP